MLSTWQIVTQAQQPMLCGYATPESARIDSFVKQHDEHPDRWP